MRFKIVFLILVFGVMEILFAGTTGKLSGRIIDAETGEALIGANVIIDKIWKNGKEEPLKRVYGAAADAEGYYYIINIPPGVYTVRANMIGYQASIVKKVKILVDKTVTLDFKLYQTAIEGEEVVVVAEKKMIQMDLTSTSANVSSDVLDKLPVENFHDVINLQAGVVDGHFRGGRQGEVAYMMNGIAINDVFSGDAAFDVENNMIEQLEVISGTFNAEYGQAMSGVVNIVTKEGTDEYHFNLNAYTGDYYTNHTNIFWNKNRFRFSNIYNFEGSLTGPVYKKLLPGVTFYSAFRYFKDNGALWGKRMFLPSDSSDFSSDDPSQWFVKASGDNKYVPMNDIEQFTGHGKITARMGSGIKFSFEGLFQKKDYRKYDHLYRLNPEGDVKYHTRSNIITGILNKTFSPKFFMDLKFAYFSTHNYYYLYNKWDDSRYQSEEKQRITSGAAFLVCGTKNDREDRKTKTLTGKLEFTYQYNRVHQFKTGIEYRKNQLNYSYIQTMISAQTNFKPELPDRSSPLNNSYTHKPSEFSYYIQDKMEFKEIIVNLGMRFDYFDPNGYVPSNLNFPDTSPLKKASSKSKWSPRVGIAYPISDNGVLHVSYGHFFQVPNFMYLYENSEFEVAVRSFPIMGNSDLSPQKTVNYELGLQQQLTQDYALDLTLFYKDIRDLIATEIIEKKDTYDKYARYINKDYGMVKGITLSLQKRQVGLFGGSIDYTYQVALGNASDPRSAWMNNQKEPPVESEKKMVPLDWDRRHSLNLSLFVTNGKTYNLSFISKFGSGLPYTPAYQNQKTAPENSGRKPAFFDFSIYGYRYINIGKSRISLYVKIYNLFDRKNELDVYSDTGRAGYTLAPESSGKIRGVNTADEFYARPDFYSTPRKILIGFNYQF